MVKARNCSVNWEKSQPGDITLFAGFRLNISHAYRPSLIKNETGG